MTDNNKNFLIALSLTTTFVVVLIFFKKPKEKSNRILFPQIAKKGDNVYADAVISIKAFREALNNDENNNVLEELKTEILKDCNIRISVLDGKIIAYDKAGVEIAKEE